MLELTSESFAEVVESAEPTLVDFWAPWCGPCRALSPILESLEEDYEGRIRFAKLNIDHSPEIWGPLGLRGIPALIVYRNGVPVKTSLGLIPKRELVSFLDSAMVASERRPPKRPRTSAAGAYPAHLVRPRRRKRKVRAG